MPFFFGVDVDYEIGRADMHHCRCSTSGPAAAAAAAAGDMVFVLFPLHFVFGVGVFRWEEKISICRLCRPSTTVAANARTGRAWRRVAGLAS